uniref:Adhesion molecule with Ig like domain 1 n=1 Tax=Serinus canaria TaxID=9135 RepID=A0A8C9MF00_SERCA
YSREAEPRVGGAGCPIMPPSHQCVAMRVPTVLLSLLLALSLLSPWGSAAGSCPPRCVCASNLHNNVTRHNGLAFVSTEAFAHVPRLRHLDLSSNRLRTLDENLFSDLGELEVLLLYNNEIATVDRTAFENLGRLRKLYLGQNRIARFPLELLREGTRLPQLALLDLSANRLRAVPAGELQALPAWLHRTPPNPCSHSHPPKFSWRDGTPPIPAPNHISQIQVGRG